MLRRRRTRTRQLPLARTAIAATAVAALVFVVFTAGKVRLRMPWAPKPFVVRVALVDAAGLDEADHPIAGVAGTRQGRVTKVRYVGGRAIATLELDRDVQGKVFKNATAAVRPVGIVPVLAVNVLPGTPRSGRLTSGATIPTERSSTYVAPDRVVSILDADTRAYLQVLVDQSATALHGRGGALAQDLQQLAPLARTAERVTASVADRRALVRRLVGQLSSIAQTLDARRDDLGGAVDAGGRVLAVTAQRSRELASSLRQLPALLGSAQGAVREVGDLASPLDQGLDATAPALSALPAGMARLRGLLPAARSLMADMKDLEAEGATQLPAVREFTTRLQPAATRGMPDVTAAARVAASLAKYGKGVAQLGDTISGAVSTSDVNGVSARAQFTSLEPPKPENLGFSAADARVGPSGTSRMMRVLARVFERECAHTQLACVLRATVPGLPELGG